MNLTLYYNYSDNNRVYKNLSVALSASGTLRDKCSVQDPVIMINADDLHNANYMYIAEFERYYYITNVVSVRENLWAIYGHVDVLMTYANGISNCYGIVARTAEPGKANLYLDDDKFVIESRKKIETIAFPNSPATGGKTFVLTMSG